MQVTIVGLNQMVGSRMGTGTLYWEKMDQVASVQLMGSMALVVVQLTRPWSAASSTSS